MDGKLLKRVREAGYEISYDPAQDGNCFYRAAAFHLGIDWQTLKDAVFEHLESNQFDVSCSHTVLYADKLDYVNGLCYKYIPFNQYYHLWLLLDGNDRLSFLCEVDVGQVVPNSWLEALALMKRTFANSLVIGTLAEVVKRNITIITVHGVSENTLFSMLLHV